MNTFPSIHPFSHHAYVYNLITHRFSENILKIYLHIQPTINTTLTAGSRILWTVSFLKYDTEDMTVHWFEMVWMGIIDSMFVVTVWGGRVVCVYSSSMSKDISFHSIRQLIRKSCWNFFPSKLIYFHFLSSISCSRWPRQRISQLLSFNSFI